LVAVFVAAISGSWCWVAKPPSAAPEWPGVDESVIQRFAAASEAVRPSFSIDWVRGDLLLLAFLWAGLVSGAALGYCAHALFGARRDDADTDADAGARPASRVEPR
jgi:hypothetical protein